MKLPTDKCCLCFPLRRGLLCMAYVRLILCIVTIGMLVLVCVSMFKRMEDSFDDALVFFQSVASIIPQALDLVFTLMFIVAAHEKTLKLSEVYYFYCITMMLVYLLVVTLSTWTWNKERFNMLIYTVFPSAWFMSFTYYEFIIFGVTVILLQTYMTLLVRSEVKKLKKLSIAEMARQRSVTSFRLPKLNTNA